MPKNPIVSLISKELSIPSAGSISAGSLARRIVKVLDTAGFEIVPKEKS